MCESREFLPAPSFAQFEVVLIRRQHYLIRTRAQKKKKKKEKKSTSRIQLIQFKDTHTKTSDNCFLLINAGC